MSSPKRRRSQNRRNCMRAVRERNRYVVFAVVAVCLACNRDYTIQLPNGYFVARVYSGAFAIVNPANRVVTEQSRHGIALAVAGDIVIGEIDPSSPNGPHLAESGRLFVINTRTNEMWLTLTRKEYLDRLRSLDIDVPRRLVHVDRFVTLHTLRSAG